MLEKNHNQRKNRMIQLLEIFYEKDIKNNQMKFFYYVIKMSFGAKECEYCILVEFHFHFTSNHTCNCKSISFQNETEEDF